MCTFRFSLLNNFHNCSSVIFGYLKCVVRNIVSYIFRCYCSLIGSFLLIACKYYCMSRGTCPTGIKIIRRSGLG